MAEPTGLEPATSDVTGRRSNQLNYDSAFQFLDFRSEISDWWARRDSNPQPLPCKGSRLPLTYVPSFKNQFGTIPVTAKCDPKESSEGCQDAVTDIRTAVLTSGHFDFGLRLVCGYYLSTPERNNSLHHFHVRAAIQKQALSS